MERICNLETEAFSIFSIIEVDAAVRMDSSEIDGQSILIESFTQPFPMQERGHPLLAEREMDSYGKDTAAI
jgi:hypothetical protein